MTSTLGINPSQKIDIFKHTHAILTHIALKNAFEKKHPNDTSPPISSTETQLSSQKRVYLARLRCTQHHSQTYVFHTWTYTRTVRELLVYTTHTLKVCCMHNTRSLCTCHTQHILRASHNTIFTVMYFNILYRDDCFIEYVHPKIH